MFENFKGVDEEKMIKEHIVSFSSDNTTPLQADNVDYIGEINYFLMVEAGLTKKIGKLKYDNFYLLNDMKDHLQDKLIENVMDYDNHKDETFIKLCG